MNKIFLIIITLFAVFLTGCKSNQQIAQNRLSHDYKYDSEFPAKSISQYLDKVSNSVKKLNSIAYYKTYYFSENEKITEQNITDALLSSHDNSSEIQHETVSGTAFIIYSENNTVGLLTCAHTIDFEDTIFSYHNENKEYLIACTIKVKQQNHFSGLKNDGDPVIVISDKEKDIAIIKQKVTTDNGLQVIDLPIGSSQNLQWGSIIYTVGYPLGILMVTQSIVSINPKLQSGMFISDASYNQGISGSPVIAIRDGIPNIELVGMASASSANTSLILSPDKDFKVKGSLYQEYEGEIFVDKSRLINYGISYSITIDEIINFINSNSKKLSDSGLNTERFFQTVSK